IGVVRSRSGGNRRPSRVSLLKRAQADRVGGALLRRAGHLHQPLGLAPLGRARSRPGGCPVSTPRPSDHAPQPIRTARPRLGDALPRNARPGGGGYLTGVGQATPEPLLSTRQLCAITFASARPRTRLSTSLSTEAR